MSDLISRKKVIDILEKEKKLKVSYDADITIFSIEKGIRELPTAYSVAKVFEELESELEKGNIAIDFGEFRLLEIVKQGGVSNDVCEWKTNDNQHMFAMWETECGTQTMIQKLPSYKYCPYCGKKIKIVGD